GLQHRHGQRPRQRHDKHRVHDADGIAVLFRRSHHDADFRRQQCRWLHGFQQHERQSRGFHQGTGDRFVDELVDRRDGRSERPLVLIFVAALFLGAAWRRWFGSERPSWAYPGYRATQVALGFIVLALLQVIVGDPFWRCALDSGIAIGFMTLPISISRQPFLWITKKLPLPTTKNDWLNGPEPWAEVLQGAVLWGL